MKEMQYIKDRICIVLAKGKIGKFYWFVVNYGWHPCAYVGIPKGHKYFNKHYNDFDLSVHGGLTFSDKEMPYQIIDLPNIYWIGWDYAHLGDWIGYHDEIANKKLGNERQWTTNEIIQHVKSAIRQLKSRRTND